MKTVLLFLILINAIGGFSFEYPKFNGAINDMENLLPDFAEKRLAKKISKKKEASGRQVILITTGHFGGKSNSKDFLISLYKHWQFSKTNLRNKVVLFISKSKKEVRLFVGKNIGEAFSKLKRQEILDRIIRPKIHDGNYKAAIKRGIKAILKQI